MVACRNWMESEFSKEDEEEVADSFAVSAMRAAHPVPCFAGRPTFGDWLAGVSNGCLMALSANTPAGRR